MPSGGFVQAIALLLLLSGIHAKRELMKLEVDESTGFIDDVNVWNDTSDSEGSSAMEFYIRYHRHMAMVKQGLLLDNFMIAVQQEMQRSPEAKQKKLQECTQTEGFHQAQMRHMIGCVANKCPAFGALMKELTGVCSAEHCESIKAEPKCKDKCTWQEETKLCLPAPPPVFPQGCPIRALVAEAEMCSNLGNDAQACREISDCEVDIKPNPMRPTSCSDWPGPEEQWMLGQVSSCVLNEEVSTTTMAKRMGSGSKFAKFMTQGLACVKATDPKKCQATATVGASSMLAIVTTNGTLESSENHIETATEPCRWVASRKSKQCQIQGAWLKNIGFPQEVADAFDHKVNTECEALSTSDCLNHKQCVLSASANGFDAGPDLNEGPGHPSCKMPMPKAVMEEFMSVTQGSGALAKCFSQDFQKMTAAMAECSAKTDAECGKVEHCTLDQKTFLDCGTQDLTKIDAKSCNKKCKEVKYGECSGETMKIFCPALGKTADQVMAECAQVAMNHLCFDSPFADSDEAPDICE